MVKKINKIMVFEGLGLKAQSTRNAEDIREFMRFGIENNFSTKKIRKILHND